MNHQADRDSWLEQAMAQWEVPLLRTCCLLLKDVALAEDAVQESFVKAWRCFSSYRQEASEKTWLLKIAVNTCRDLQRSKWFIHKGTGVLPEELTVYVYSMWEGIDEPDITSLDGIRLEISK